MTYFKTLAFSFIAVLVLMISCGKPKPLRLATYTYATNDRMANLEPLAAMLEARLERPVAIKSYPDVASFISGIRSNEVDIALINTLGYLLLSLDNDHMEPVATLHVKDDAKDNYKTVLLTNQEGIRNLDDLRQYQSELAVQFVAEGSTSGNLVPRLLLSSMGIKSPDTQFRSVTYGGNHTSTFERLVSGESQVCAIGSNEYFQQITTDPSLLSSIDLLWISDEIPLGPVLLNKALIAQDQELITNLLLQLHVDRKDVLESIKDGWSEAKQAHRYYAITDDYYDDFRKVNGNSTDLADILQLFKK